jgi:hypothetical protein
VYARLALLTTALLAVGCGQKGVVPVSGKASLDDKPLAFVHVSFQPVAEGNDKNPGGGSYAITDGEGRFTLKLVEGDRAGAFAGKHRVAFTARDDTEGDLDRRGKAPKHPVVIPAKFGPNGDLTFQVPPGGTSSADVALKSR